MLSYILPIRWSNDDGIEELTAYLEWLAPRCQLVIVDGSEADLFKRHHARWAHILAKHIAPDRDLHFLNGKVNGISTGTRRAMHERMVFADDDVRYGVDELEAIVDTLGAADMVIPQNYFDPLPWHAAWDSARSLLNRSIAHDWPGTIALRRSLFQRMGGYSGDILFENLELVRTARAAGARVVCAQDMFVRRLPPDVRTFLRQRVRQAYDEFARPGLLVLWLCVIPFLVVAIVRKNLLPMGAYIIVTMALALMGRRQGGGRVFPARTVLFAPAWVLERSAASWIALAYRLAGGVPYAGRRLKHAATPQRVLNSCLRLNGSGLFPESPVHLSDAER